MTKKINDFWLVLALFSLFYFFGLSFISFLGLAAFVFWFLRKKPISWWPLTLFCLANILVFRTPFFLLAFSLFFYFYLRHVRQPADANETSWFLVFLLFVLGFDLFFAASNYRFILGFSWALFFGLIFWLSRFYFKDYSKITRLVFSFVFSQLFFILYFLPFGNFTNAGTATILFLALANYKKNHSLKQLLVLMFLCILLLWISGIKPR